MWLLTNSIEWHGIIYDSYAIASCHILTDSETVHIDVCNSPSCLSNNWLYFRENKWIKIAQVVVWTGRKWPCAAVFFPSVETEAYGLVTDKQYLSKWQYTLSVPRFV